MPKHTAQLIFKTDAGQVPLDAVVYNIDTEINESITVPAGTTVHAVVTFAHAKVNDYCISANGTLTVKWNDQTTPVPEMALTKAGPSFYAPDFGGSNLFTADITGLYAINAGLTDVILTVHVGLNDVV